EFCDDQSRTVTVAKVKASNEILGGYNPIAWESNDDSYDSYETTKDSFIFSFENNNRTESHILSRVIDEKHAIYNNFLCGPSFGDDDLHLLNICGECFTEKKYYDKSIRKFKNSFYIDECEVFKIIKR